MVNGDAELHHLQMVIFTKWGFMKKSPFANGDHRLQMGIHEKSPFANGDFCSPHL
jgi:hypothetical protein